MRKEYVDAGKITYDLVVEIIIDAIHNKLEVDDALERGARIVLLNGTSDVSGHHGTH